MATDRLRRYVVEIVSIAVMAGACGGSPTQPSSPAAPAPLGRPSTGFECPATVTVESLTGEPIRVNYPSPVWGDGTLPGSVRCLPPSGSLFSLGTTTVACLLRTADGETSGCIFEVRVVKPHLKVTRFLAFGDSLTEGVVADPLLGPHRVVNHAAAYPTRLLRRLQDRYRGQSFEMINAGRGGEQAVDGAVRLRGVLATTRPQVLLLMEGTNDLFFYRRDAAVRAIPALDEMIQHARAVGVDVLLATIPPQRPGGLRDEVARIIPSFNEQVRALARRRQVPLVDVFEELQKDLSLIGDDDLHPTERGYDVMAGVFFDVIKTVYETAVTSLASSQETARPGSLTSEPRSRQEGGATATGSFFQPSPSVNSRAPKHQTTSFLPAQ